MAQANVATLAVVHEDLSDELVLLNPASTLFTSTCPKGSAAEGDVYYAPIDKHTAGALGGQVDGASVDRSTVTNRLANRVKLQGVVQHWRETYGVSHLAEMTQNPAGVTNAVNHSEMKAMTTMKESMEITHLSQQEQQVGSTSVKYQERGASRWIDSAAQPNLAVDSNYRPDSTLTVTASATSAITEANVKTVLQKLFEAKKTNVSVTGFCTPDFATQFDTFFESHSTAGTTVNVRSWNRDGNASDYKLAVTSYATRFGRVDIVPTLLLNGVRSFSGSLAGAATTNTSTTVTVTSTTGLQPYMRLYGTGIPSGAYIASITNATTFVISAAATATGSPTLRLGELDHCLFLDMGFFELKTNQRPEGVDLSPDGSGTQGYVESIQSLFCTDPAIHGKINSTAV